MVGLLTFGNRKFESLDGTMRAAIEPLHTAMQKMLTSVDRDTDAFTDYMVSGVRWVPLPPFLYPFLSFIPPSSSL